MIILKPFLGMAEGNGDMHEDIVSLRVDDRGDGERTEDYVKLLEYGLDRKVIVTIRSFLLIYIIGSKL